jgi:hypothetical protein
MACGKSLEETEREIAAAALAKTETVAEVTPAGGDGEVPATFDGKGHVSSGGESGDFMDEGASDNENWRMYCFGASTITVDRIKEMSDKGYFVEGEARASGEETTPEPNKDNVVVFEDFFVAGLCMPPRYVLADILLKFQAQLHQLTPNAIAQLSKYFWVVGSFGGVSSSDVFVKQYELHYQPKRIETKKGPLFVQYSCLNFHAKRDGGSKLRITIKNKWSAGWMKAWFYCRVPCRRSFEGGLSRQ